jgi:hypothetical protein
LTLVSCAAAAHSGFAHQLPRSIWRSGRAAHIRCKSTMIPRPWRRVVGRWPFAAVSGGTCTWPTFSLAICRTSPQPAGLACRTTRLVHSVSDAVALVASSRCLGVKLWSRAGAGLLGMTASGEPATGTTSCFGFWRGLYQCTASLRLRHQVTEDTPGNAVADAAGDRNAQ